MIFCPRCKNKMHIMFHFSQEKHYKNKQCPVCYYETRPEKIRYEDVINKNKDFNESSETHRTYINNINNKSHDLKNSTINNKEKDKNKSSSKSNINETKKNKSPISHKKKKRVGR